MLMGVGYALRLIQSACRVRAREEVADAHQPVVGLPYDGRSSDQKNDLVEPWSVPGSNR